MVVDPGAGGLGEMLAGLVSANLEQHPSRERFLKGARGEVNVEATDAGTACGLRFEAGRLTVGVPSARPHLRISTTSDLLMSLTTVPLRFGLPDALRRDGRKVTGHLAARRLRVVGMFRHLGLLRRVQSLISVE